MSIPRHALVLIALSFGWFASCSNPATPAPEDAASADTTDSLLTVAADTTAEEKAPTEELPQGEPVVLDSGTYDPSFLSDDSLAMEAAYRDMLAPIASLKTNDPRTYWFIVSWLNTAYRTPNWDGYDQYDTWRRKTLKKGIDCSGFTRVMQDRIFGRKVRGGSQGILDTQCKRVPRSELAYGDLVFFRAPYAKNDRIVHVGVYLMDGLFVHATSTKSAAEGRGLMVNSLDEENWAAEYVTGGKVIQN